MADAKIADILGVDLPYANELSELCATSFAEAYKGVNSEADIQAYCKRHYSIAVIKSNLSNPDMTYRVAFRKGKAVGFFLVKNQSCPLTLDGGAVELKQIYVLASEFGTGLGKQLLHDAIRHVHDAGKAWIWLSVSDLNHRASAFYLKHGFSALGVAPQLEVGDDCLPATIMAREVHRAA